MLVYGDRSRLIAPANRLSEIGALLRRPLVGQARHDALMRALIEAGELAQGLADAEFEARGVDDHTPLQAAALALATALARKVEASWRSGFADAGPPADRELAALAATAAPSHVRCKQAEGFAHYAVYPEAYMDAAGDLRGSRPLVIGIRSIGATLGAAVAAAADAAGFVTVRPHGHPFDRRLSVSDALRRALIEHQDLFAVVDEGPGLSGSSFGAVADLLADLGVTEDRLVFMPSHGGSPGHAAPKRHRARWARVRRCSRTLDDLAPPAAIGRWFEDLVGQAVRVEDISHGEWRADLPAGARPPCWPAMERRKVRLTTSSGTYIARFAGLGGLGEEKLRTGRLLGGAGYTAEPLALRRGFLLERWLLGVPLTRADVADPCFGRTLAYYLAFRAGKLPAAEPGASLDDLAAMALVNAEEACGSACRDAVARRLEGLIAAGRGLAPVRIDGRLHPWEWRRGPDGAIRKTDALDHACAHDLIGGQPLAWDAAGAAVEFGLKTDLLGRQAGAAPRTVELFEGLYCAFQAGLWTMAADGQDDGAAQARGEAERYSLAMRRWAQASPHAASA